MNTKNHVPGAPTMRSSMLRADEALPLVGAILSALAVLVALTAIGGSRESRSEAAFPVGAGLQA